MSEPVTAHNPSADEVKPDTVTPVEPTLETKAEEPVATAESTPAAEPTASADSEPVEEKAAAAPVEPITSGVLGYKAPGLIKSLKFSKRYFWLGDEPVPTQSLSHYLRGTEGRIAHPVAAWSSQTGKGLLYLVKAESEKSHPHDVLPLADASDLHKASSHEFAFKIHGDKHTFKATSDAERDGWYTAIEKTIEEAKASKDEIRKSEGYQESVKHLGKPAVLASGAAVGGAAAAAAVKKEDDTATEPTETAEPAEVPAPVDSTASDEAVRQEKKDTKKSRSVSRGKRASIFGSFLNKKEDKSEEKTATEGAVPAAATEAPVANEAAPEEAKTQDVVEPTAATPATVAETTESKEEAPVAPKPTKRNSIFGSIYQKVRSPTHERKESELLPVVPPKDESSATAEPTAPVTEETPVLDVTQPENTATETKAEEAAAPAAVEEPKEAKADSPKKEKESFLGSLLSKARAKSPSAANKRSVSPAVPAKEESAVEESKPEEAVPAATEATTTAPAEEAAPATTETTPKEPRRKSLFSGENKKLGSIFRRQKSEKEVPTTTEKENAVPTITAEEPAAAAPAEEKFENAVEQPSETIGDVPAEAIAIGKPQETTPTVSATA